jgi:hypothetical protein
MAAVRQNSTPRHIFEALRPPNSILTPQTKNHHEKHKDLEVYLTLIRRKRISAQKFSAAYDLCHV